MKIKIKSQEENPLLDRREVAFEVDHKEVAGTPSRQEVRKELASKLKKDIELVYVKRMETQTGTMTAIGQATTYESIEQAKLVEPEHIMIRNVPPEKPEKEKEEQKIETEKKGKEKGEQEGEETGD